MDLKHTLISDIHHIFRVVSIHPLLLIEGIRYYLLRIYGFPDLPIAWFRIMKRLQLVFIARKDYPVFSFSSFDLWLRSYYLKLSRNFEEVGRWGYVWDESLGFPMAGRFGSNLVTYRLYSALSPQVFSGLTYLLFFLSLLITGIYSDHVILSVIIAILLSVSPAILFSLLGYGIKPEMFWWGLAIPALYCALTQEWDIALILLGSLLLVNTSVSIILSIFLVLPFALSIGQELFQPGIGLVWFSVASMIRIFRIWQSFHEQILNFTVREQRDTRRPQIKNRWNPKTLTSHIRTLVFANLKETTSLVILFLILGWEHWLEALALVSSLIGFEFINKRIIKIADNVTEQTLRAVTASALALFSGAWISLIGVLIIGYKGAFTVAWHMSGQNENESLSLDQNDCDTPKQRIHFFARLTKTYPWLAPIEYPKPERLANFFNHISDSSRIIMEGVADPRQGIGFHRFRDWTNEFLPNRQIEFINHTFMNRLLEPDLFAEYLQDFSVPNLTSNKMDEVCRKLGISYVIAYKRSTIDSMTARGYLIVDVIPEDAYKSLSNLLYMPSLELTLLKNPNPTSMIFPSVEWKRNKNTIHWIAQKGKTYEVKYRYHKNFVAVQGTTLLPIDSYLPFDHLRTRFMRIHAEQDGLLQLIFTSKWNFRKPRITLRKGIINESIASN